MIVCVCNAICERRLAAVIAAGADTPEKVERHCGAGGDCGACRPDIEQAIERHTLCAPRHPGHALPVLPPGVTP